MAWFGRKGRDADPPSEDESGSWGEDAGAASAAAGSKLVAGEDLLEPVVEPLGSDERRRISDGLEALAAEGVDVDDLASIGAGLDAAYRAWRAAEQSSSAADDHAAIVERYAIGIGEYLDRHTDLDWQVVTDVFGTDLALTEGFRGAFVVVPHNLVAGRWMRGETGWVPAVVGHMVNRRSRR
ncbi:DUF3806 domain-containing protein [Knoellia koreensis]|uniref:DUF3806 domain-containing protein n=1 Tax=Knoellia koreensis TaxID=2730921 RepID=A0A849HLD3_9MICO|nr:DUF3806 domain-containing protein [Knoellia sp. DB2414S]NNM48228.1 DUF3806 domain-containing protein [Knoellia sp. DB2414S]